MRAALVFSGTPPHAGLPRGDLLACGLLLSAFLGGACDPSGKSKETGDDETGEGVQTTEHCGGVSGDGLWSAADNPHVLTCDVEVTGSLTLEPGVEIYLDPGTRLAVLGGTLSAAGTQENPILLESNAVFPLAGDHGGLVAEDATLNLSWVTVRHGGLQGGLIDIDGGTSNLENLTLANGSSQGLRCLQGEFTALSGVAVAYVSIPVVIPWNAAQVMSEVVFEEVGVEPIVLYGDVLDREVLLPPQAYPYSSGSLTIAAGGRLELEAGTTLQLGGDVEVEAGGLVVWGDVDESARLEAADEDPVTVRLGAGADTASFRYAALDGVMVESYTSALLFKDSSITGVPGTALTIAGGVKDQNPENLQNNILAGDGPGLLVIWTDLDDLGENDCSGSSFDGVAVSGDTLAESLWLEDLPFSVLVTEDLTVAAGTLVLESAGTFRFQDGLSLVVDGGQVEARSSNFLHVDDRAGGWVGLVLAAGSDDSSLEDCEIGHGGQGDGANLRIASSATISGNLIRNSAAWGVIVESGAEPTVAGNTYLNNQAGNERWD